MVYDSSPFLVPAMSAWMCPVVCRAGVSGHARRMRGGT